MSLPYLQPYFGLGNSLQTAQAGGAGGAVGGWVELARTTLGSAGDTISVTSLPDKRYYMILADQRASGNTNHSFRLNSDSGNNYSQRASPDGGSDNTLTSTSALLGNWGSAVTTNAFHVGYLSNLSANEKLAQIWNVQQKTAGAGNAPSRQEGVGKHAQTSNPINAVSLTNTDSGDYTSGSEVVVLGWDPADTHTTNFWEEIGSADLSGGSADDLDITTGLDKKYLWVQLYIEPSGQVDVNLTFNNDGSANYTRRQSFNGGADGTSINESNVPLSTNITTPVFYNFFMINNSSNEKLVIHHEARQSTAGAGNAPDREEQVFKWANTSSQISRIDINNPDTGSFGTNSIIKVFGSD